MVAGPAPYLGEAECWFVGARSVVHRAGGEGRDEDAGEAGPQVPLAKGSPKTLVGPRPLGVSVRPQWTGRPHLPASRPPV